jgi:hypothetical protein
MAATRRGERPPTMKQRWLPEFDGPEREEPPDLDGDLAGGPFDAGRGEIPVLPGQIALFTAERELLGLIESAIVAGRFEDALELRDALVGREGPSPDTRQLSLLDRLGAPAFWARPVEQCVDDWMELERGWEAAEGVHDLVRDAVLFRLTSIHGAAIIVRARPSLLALVVNFLGRPGTDAEAPTAGESLRDSLASGLSAPSGDFDDLRFVDLLAEDRSPEWLASVGALTRLWPVPVVPASEVDLPLSPLPGDDEGRGRQFWHCLRLSVSCPRDSARAIEARKRMKVLDSSLHAQFMRQGVRRD